MTSPPSVDLRCEKERQRWHMDSLGKILVVAGLLLAAVGAALWLFGRAGGGFLPGDIVVERKNFRFYFPIATSLLLSVILSFCLWLWRR